ncbi:MAG: MFS transporter [Devosia nanyangense]|uniref:MFS transporter n=1 Tax=Devosia nanyangense TaxID=1228055 RepID=A0A933L2K5_9HYPH|nr:MFS transporter [Devosia nanyangense]
MTTTDNSWRAFFRTGGVAIVIFVGGVSLQAMEGFIGSAMLPTVVRDIGGIDYFAWNTTLFIVASIAASVFAAVRPAHIGPRDVYVIAAMAFGAGSLLCGLAPSMVVLLLGRTIQGFGAGLIVATTLAMIRIVFPQSMWPRAMSLNAMVWGVATLLGPAVGGIFANYDLWRWAFLSIVPLAALLAFGAVMVLPRREAAVQPGAPIPQIALIILAILLISIGSLLTGNPALAAGLLGLAGLTIAALGIVEGRSKLRLLPGGALSPRSPLGMVLVTILLLGMSITSDIFAPLFLQRLHGLTPLWAGYLTALVAAGWTVAAVTTSGFTGARVQTAIIVAPWVMTASTIGMALWLASANPDGNAVDIVLPGLCLFALGVGIGIAFQHLATIVLATGSAADNDRVSATLGMVQLFASGIGAAIGGVVVNAAGLPLATDIAGVEGAARWLFWVFAAVTALAIPFAWRVVRTAPSLAVEPAE